MVDELELLGEVVEELELALGDVDEPLIVLLELGDVLDVDPFIELLLPVFELALPESDVPVLLEVEPLSEPEPEIEVLAPGTVVVVVLVLGTVEIVVSVSVVVLTASSSGMQSMWTGLRECSLASPVSLSASLPAFGFLKLLHSGRPLLAVVVVVVSGSVVVMLVDGVVVVLESVEVDGLVVVDELSDAEPFSEPLVLLFALPLSEPEVLEPVVPLEPIVLLDLLVPLVALFLFRSLELLEVLCASTGVAARALTTAAARILRVNWKGFMSFLR